jgi:hypothetical protein
MRRLLRPPTRAYRGLLVSVLRTFHGSSLTDHDIPFVRYTDDFLMFTPNRHKALQFVEKRLCDLGLEFNKDRTRVVQSSPGLSFLG